MYWGLRSLVSAVAASLWCAGAFAAACPVAGSDCAIAATTGYQPYPAELVNYFDAAAQNTLRGNGPTIGPISKGYPNWTEMYDWICREGQRPDVVAQLIEAAMQEVSDGMLNSVLNDERIETI